MFYIEPRDPASDCQIVKWHTKAIRAARVLVRVLKKGARS